MSKEEVLDIKKVVKTETVKLIVGGVISVIALAFSFYITTQIWMGTRDETIQIHTAEIKEVKEDVKNIKKDIALVKRDPELASAQMTTLTTKIEAILTNQQRQDKELSDLRATQNKFYDEIIDLMKQNKKK